MTHTRTALFGQAAFLALLSLGLNSAISAAIAAPSAAPGYTLNVFAGPLVGSSAPDSIAVVGSHVFVGYGGSGAPDGSGGAMSTIAEYSSGGSLVSTITVAGHNDGLKYDAATGQLWALQNEDANPNLVLINPVTLSTATPLPFSATSHGGGYDDIAFGANGTYISASNPANNPNTAPAIVGVSLAASQVTVNGGVLAGNGTANVLNPGGSTTTLNLQDPDSMTFAPNGQLVLDSQADHQLVFVSNIGTPGQTVNVLNLQDEVDDTVFGDGGQQTLLFADRDSGIVYSLTGAFGAGQAVSAADVLNEIAAVDLGNGAFSPLVTGLDSPHGEAFLSTVPEPSTWAVLLVGLGGVGASLRRMRRQTANVMPNATNNATS